ncbi:hypothetical protein GOBAR_DD09048 [Gossypium barbadense]|nr:hypothetical protein GOBAR_DD09048 [Gossypium barbadense]
MDRLVKVDVKEVEIVFMEGQKTTTNFTLTNLMHTMSVAVCLSTKNSSFFSFNNQFSIIPPLSSSTYTLFSQPSDQPPLTNPPDAITVKTTMLPLGKAHHDDLRRLFSKPGPHVFKDATLPISFTGHHVIQHLISSNTQMTDMDIWCNKAISGCFGDQLTVLLKSAVVSGKVGLVRTLIDHRGDVNYKDDKGRSLVSLAVEAGHVDVVNALISAGCEIDNTVDHVLHYAAAKNRVDLMDVLFRGYKNMDLIDSIDFNGRTPIHISAIHGHTESIKFCLSLVSNYTKYALNGQGKTAFALAVENDRSNLYDPLHLGDALHRAARIGDVNGMKCCISEGANMNGKDQNGWTPLHRAAFKGKTECVRALISYGGDINGVDNNGYTPLHRAVEAGHVETALVLIGHGAKANVKCLKGIGMGVALKSDCSKNHCCYRSSFVQPL